MFREIQRLALKSEKQNFVGVTHVTQCFYANSFNIILWSKETCVFLWSWTYLWTIKCLIPIESTLVWDVEHSLFTKLESQRNTRDVEWPFCVSVVTTECSTPIVFCGQWVRDGNYSRFFALSFQWCLASFSLSVSSSISLCTSTYRHLLSIVDNGIRDGNYSRFFALSSLLFPSFSFLAHP